LELILDYLNFNDVEYLFDVFYIKKDIYNNISQMLYKYHIYYKYFMINLYTEEFI
jgi:hypothetical protein